jgi:hypothetical protein
VRVTETSLGIGVSWSITISVLNPAGLRNRRDQNFRRRFLSAMDSAALGAI